jgi:hypothetical protein
MSTFLGRVVSHVHAHEFVVNPYKPSAGAKFLEQIAAEYVQQDVLPTRPNSDTVTLLRRLLNSNEPKQRRSRTKLELEIKLGA